MYGIRGKPGWGRESTRPPWWPKDLPWANVRMDARSEDEKQKYHGREDLLPAFTEDDDDKHHQRPSSPNVSTSYKLCYTRHIISSSDTTILTLSVVTHIV
ncbi:unnamed protein product [Leptidea sinapis]|uniref:Nuclear respiratory factor 1 NLS/DNA-binding dimerisation domain-containing protein n=1 Tax=Leptidea sinapis TaxID=189913 RepID=A0A5E4R440_9NEOP|nr:unnamed protein product [Leptidea sinapis]